MVRQLPRNRWSFSLRALLGVMFLVAVCAAWIHHESVGRLVPQLTVALDSSEVRTVEIDGAADFDALTASIIIELRRTARDNRHTPVDVAFNEFKTRDRRYLAYTFDVWVRRRLNPWRLEYVLDINDPGARSRNRDVVATIERVAGHNQDIDSNLNIPSQD